MAGPGSVPLLRYVNAATGSHYYSVAGDPPAGYQSDSTLGHLEAGPGDGRLPLYRHFNAATGDYLLSTAEAPPTGYVSEGLLGYAYSDGGASPAAPAVTYVYDLGPNGKGRRSSMTDGAGTVTYAYDLLGRPTSVVRPVDGVAYTTQTTYTAMGQVATITYPHGYLVPDGEVVIYTYDAGQVIAVTGAAPYASGITYNAAGQVLSLTYGNGVIRTHTYEATTLRLTHLTTQKPTAAPLQNFSYGYDLVGNLIALTDERENGTESQTFTYDAVNRLTSATGAYGSHTYSYSAIGNILTKAGVTYTYGATGQTCGRFMPHAVTGTSNGKSYTYDCNGNTLTDGERTFTWTPENKPASITRGGATTTFLYSGDGARLKKVGLNSTIRYAGGIEDHVTDGSTLKHITVTGLAVATRVVGGQHPGVYYTHGDHLGSLHVLTNSSATEVQRLTYLPFGETHTNTGSLNFSTRRYTGQIEDPETGLYFYNARYYNPVLGRFVSPDSIVPDPGNPQSLNRYSYVENNPLTRIDPSGHGWFSSIFKPILRVVISIGMVAGSIVAAALQQYWAIPVIAAAGSAALTALNGGAGEQILLSAVVGAGASLVGMGVGWGVGEAVGSISSPALDATTSQALGAVAGNVSGASAGGFVQETGLRLALGGSWRDAIRAGYQTAALAAGTAAVAEVAFKRGTSIKL